MMKRRGVRFDKGALIGVPVTLLLLFGSSSRISSRRCRRGADDESAVRLLFQPAVLDFLASLDPAFDQTIEGAGECVVMYRGGREVGAAEVRAFVSKAAAVASRFGAGAEGAGP